MIDLAKHRELDAEASPCPWVRVPEEQEVHGTLAQGTRDEESIHVCGSVDDEVYKDSQLICLMRNDHMAMVDEIERLRAIVKSIDTVELQGQETCPECGGEPDNGFDRYVPRSAYVCSKCEDQP